MEAKYREITDVTDDFVAINMDLSGRTAKQYT